MENRFNNLTSKEWLPFQKSWFIFDNKFNLIEKYILPNEISNYEEAFLTGTAAEITPIKSIEKDAI